MAQNRDLVNYIVQELGLRKKEVRRLAYYPYREIWRDMLREAPELSPERQEVLAITGAVYCRVRELMNLGPQEAEAVVARLREEMGD